MNPLVQSPSIAEMFISPPRFHYSVQLSNTSFIYWYTSWYWTCCASTSKCQMTDSLWYVSIEDIQYIPPNSCVCLALLHLYLQGREGKRGGSNWALQAFLLNSYKGQTRRCRERERLTQRDQMKGQTIKVVHTTKLQVFWSQVTALCDEHVDILSHYSLIIFNLKMTFEYLEYNVIGQ